MQEFRGGFCGFYPDVESKNDNTKIADTYSVFVFAYGGCSDYWIGELTSGMLTDQIDFRWCHAPIYTPNKFLLWCRDLIFIVIRKD